MDAPTSSDVAFRSLRRGRSAPTYLSSGHSNFWPIFVQSSSFSFWITVVGCNVSIYCIKGWVFIHNVVGQIFGCSKKSTFCIPYKNLKNLFLLSSWICGYTNFYMCFIYWWICNGWANSRNGAHYFGKIAMGCALSNPLWLYFAHFTANKTERRGSP